MMKKNLKQEVENIARQAKNASSDLATLSCATKNLILKEMAAALLSRQAAILKANQKDVLKSRRLGAAFIDRLTLNEARIKQMSDSLSEIAKLKDPVDEVMRAWNAANGLSIQKVRSPIGVVAIIYESRPNVTADCIGLCFKSGNSVILRGGSEALNSNLAIFKVLQEILQKHNLAKGSINLISTADRKAVDYLLKLNDYIDVVIPRGGEELIKKVVAASRIPVIKHYKGICHVYVDEDADLNMAQDICFNAKVQRPGVCNAMESMLVHRDVAGRFLPGMLKKFQEAGVQVRGCVFTRKIAKWAKPATEQDYHTEYLDLILSVKVVDSLDAAIAHINKYGSHHSDSIVTDNNLAAAKFLKQVDSACVYLNASTRFTDGNQFGMGAEIGISTDKLHARGPMALEELTTYKYLVYGCGQVRR
ncbi:MAG TPA: glutamate-5-semialdehyde dehydrogenase [Candidatus Omnitrophota bacterium]|nr:glutamate-5-semialdehyde dehydrogenase [Candidatus Omnitrophota bacterium]HPT39690.1 glutamate-5-semialdehyde dehydrogenase [Candidatus Omnitrophota bacterium]